MEKKDLDKAINSSYRFTPDVEDPILSGLLVFNQDCLFIVMVQVKVLQNLIQDQL